MLIAKTGQGAGGGERTERQGDSLIPTPGYGPATETLSTRDGHLPPQPAGELVLSEYVDIVGHPGFTPRRRIQRQRVCQTRDRRSEATYRRIDGSVTTGWPVIYVRASGTARPLDVILETVEFWDSLPRGGRCCRTLSVSCKRNGPGRSPGRFAHGRGLPNRTSQAGSSARGGPPEAVTGAAPAFASFFAADFSTRPWMIT